MGVYLPFIPRLPSAYQEVEYIQSSGTQRIDTGVTATQNTKSQIKFMNLEYSGDVIYGLYNSNDNTDYRFFNKYSDNTNIGAAIFDFNSSRILSGTNTILTNVVYELELGNYYVKNIETGTNIVSGTAISSYTSPRTITLNNYNNSTYSKNRWYYVKIYNGSTLQRDFVPCYRKSDNVIGLYDLVNNQFYTNSGTGTFTKGADVTAMPLKNAYIGEVHEYVFDFQNDGALSWVGTSLGYGTPALTSGQGWYIGSSSSSYQGQITPPSSIFGGNLKSIKIWFYRPLGTTSNRGFGVGADGTNARVEYGRFGSTSGRLNVYYSSSAHRSNVQDLTGEIEMDIILESNGHITINLINNGNTYSYDGGACASEFQSERENRGVTLEIARWNYSSTGYIRKVEITTVG